MRVTRLFVDQPFSSGQSVSLSEAQAHYVMNVLRMGLGDPVHLFNGRDGEWRCVIDRITRRRCSVTLEEQVSDSKAGAGFVVTLCADQESPDRFRCGQSHRAWRFGFDTRLYRVYRCYPGEFATPAGSNAMEAAEQCGRLSVPEVDEPVKLTAVLADWPADRQLLYCDETGSGAAINEFLAKQKSSGQSKPTAILIGPEGGFSRSELDLLKEKSNFTAIDLGPRILRADTAAIAVLSCWQSVLGDWPGE